MGEPHDDIGEDRRGSDLWLPRMADTWPAPLRAAYVAVASYGPPALAWEVLRRNPLYRSAYPQLAEQAVPGVAAEPAFVDQWGMHFR